MTELWDHQKLAIEKARVQPHLALFMGIGVGKTRAMIDILREEYRKHGQIQSTLIFCPLSICPQWKREFAKWSKVDQARILVLTGAGTKRIAQLQKAPPGVIVVTNYEAIRIKAFYAALLKWSPDILVLDEAHKLKDSESMQSKCIYPLASAARRRFLMTGTPFLNSMLDIFGQFTALDPCIFGASFWKFKTLYFYDKNAGMPSHAHFPDWQPRPTSGKNIGLLVAKHSVQAKKEECLDLPPLLNVPVAVELSPLQLKAYLEMEKHFVTEVNGTTIAAEFAMTKTMRMQQIIAGFAAADSESESSWFEDVPRLAALRELLEQINGDKVIIWTTFRPSYKKIAEICQAMKLSVRFLTGDESAKQKEESIEEFCRGSASVLIANPSAGGAGINLQEAKYSIYYTRGYSLEHYLQSQGRNYRGGSEIHEKITHFHIIAKDTLDEVIAEALMNKQKVGESVLAWASRLTKTSNTDRVEDKKEVPLCQ